VVRQHDLDVAASHAQFVVKAALDRVDDSLTGWPQTLLVQTPGQTFFGSARRVARNAPSSSKT
jgi:hypothetical protein